MNKTLPTYEEFMGKFEVYPTKKKAQAKGYEAHHIIPRAVQKRERGEEYDDRCIRVTYFEHILAHYLYCKEHPEDRDEFIALNFLLNMRAKELLADEKKFLEELPQMAEMREKGVQRGENHPMYKKHHTEEAKKKIVESLKGKHHTEESKKKMSDAQRGEKNHMFGRIGENHPLFGTHRSEYVKSRVSEANSKKVYQRDLEGNLIQVFNSAKEARNFFHVCKSTMTNYLKGLVPINFPYSLSYN